MKGVWNLITVCILSALLLACSKEERMFEINEVSKEHILVDSVRLNANCCMDVLVTGELDGPAWLHVYYYYDDYLKTDNARDSIFLPKGIIDSIATHNDYFGRQIEIRYFPGEAKKGKVRIQVGMR